MKPVPCAKDIMNGKPLALPPKTSVRGGARFLLEKRIPGVPIVDENGRLRGLFSQQGLMVCLVHAVHSDLPPGALDSHLDPDPPEISEDTSLITIARIFAEGRYTHCVLPVLSNGRLVGVVTRIDVIRAFLDYMAPAKDTHSQLLYLSALKDVEEPPPF